MPAECQGRQSRYSRIWAPLLLSAPRRRWALTPPAALPHHAQFR